jgi:hypothetical protein
MLEWFCRFFHVGSIDFCPSASAIYSWESEKGNRKDDISASKLDQLGAGYSTSEAPPRFLSTHVEGFLI